MLKKSYLLISPTKWIRKLFQRRKAVRLMVAETNFPKLFKFRLRAWTLSLPTNTLSCFPRCDRLTLFISKKMSAKYPSLANIVVCQLSFWVNVVFYVKAAISALCTPSNHSGIGFPSRPSLLYCRLPYACFLFCHRERDSKVEIQ